MKRKTIINRLVRIAKGGVKDLHVKGYDFVYKKAIPLFEGFQAQTKREQELLSDCYYVLGDVFDFNGAPKAAIRAYQKAVGLDPSNSAAYREIAGMFHWMGDLKQAKRNLSLSLKIDPDEKCANCDMKLLLQDIENGFSPVYKNSDLIWQVNELLASNEPKKAISIITKRRKIQYSLAMARCYGAMGDNHNYIEEWRGILNRDESFPLEYADWFYMPKKIYESPDIWEIFGRLGKRIQEGVFESFDSFYTNDLAKTFSRDQRQQIIIQYNILSCREDIQGLERMLLEFSFLSEIKREVTRIKKKLLKTSC